MIGVDLDITLKVRATALKLGVKIIDKVMISDLLTNNGRIAGACGYSILDGTFYQVHAKVVIMATGSQNYRLAPMWRSARGDGIASVYRAGAELRNPEFGNFAQLLDVATHDEQVFGENYMYNALCENVTQNFRRFSEPDISATAIKEWYVQMSTGKGPIYLHLPPTEGNIFAQWHRPYGIPFWKAGVRKRNKQQSDGKLEVVPSL